MEIRNKQISIALLILMAYVMASPVIASPLCVVQIDPETTTVVSTGETFAVELNIMDVLNLAGCEIKLGYNTSILEVVEVEVAEIPDGFIVAYVRSSYIWFIGWFVAGPINGDLTLATITFTVISPTVFFETTLDLYDTRLGDPYAHPIYHEVRDGTVTGPTAEEAIQGLITTIESWNLPKKTEASLASKLEDALFLVEKGNENGAKNKLGDFIDQVEAQRGKKLTNAQADYLVASAQAIINAIE